MRPLLQSIRPQQQLLITVPKPPAPAKNPFTSVAPLSAELVDMKLADDEAMAAVPAADEANPPAMSGATLPAVAAIPIPIME